MKVNQILCILLIICLQAPAQSPTDSGVQWMTWDEMLEAVEKDPRPVFIDIYTDWCGPCKQMDKITFSDPVIATYLNANYHNVKLNAETHDTLRYGNYTFVNHTETGELGGHDLANSLLQNRLSYPGMVVLDSSLKRQEILRGLYSAEQLEFYLHYYADGFLKALSMEEYQKEFTSSFGDSKKKKTTSEPSP